MKYFAALSVLAAIPAMVSGLTVNTITTGVQECEPVLFTWVGGQAPYYLSLAPNKDTSAAPIKNFGQLSGTSYTWTVDLALGTSFTTILKDSTGTTALSDLQTVAAGSGSSCVNSTVTETGGSVGTYSQTAAGTDGAASTAGASTVETTSASGNAAAKTSGSASGTKSSAAATGSATTTGTSGAGRASVGAFGLAALMGLVGAALF